MLAIIKQVNRCLSPFAACGYFNCYKRCALTRLEVRHPQVSPIKTKTAQRGISFLRRLNIEFKIKLVSLVSTLKSLITCGVNVNFGGILRLGKPTFFNTLKTLKYIISFENDLATIISC